jgi:signal peptidase I
MDETQDYTKYSLDQLEQALRHTDEETYPLRFRQIVDEIDKRRREPIRIDTTETMLARRRIPLLALFLSLQTPGLGQLYNGQPKRGIVLAAVFSVTAALPFLFAVKLLYSFSGLLLFLIALMIFAAVYLFIFVDAFRGAVREKEFRLKRYNRWYVYISIMAIVHFIPWPPDLPKQELIDTFHSYRIVGDSMGPTLERDDCVVVATNYYNSRTPIREDIVVFPRPDDESRIAVKRVIALEGEKVELKDKTVYINGKKIADPWGHSSDSRGLSAAVSRRDNMEPLRIPDGSIFVLADSRDNSLDSRCFGAVKKETILGKPLYIYWAKNKKRIGMTIK